MSLNNGKKLNSVLTQKLILIIRTPILNLKLNFIMKMEILLFVRDIGMAKISGKSGLPVVLKPENGLGNHSPRILVIQG